jgi:F-type H+-transporting ATPase subunit epsilon
MADALLLELVTPEREVIRESVDEVQVPAANGYLGVLPGHTPLLAELGTGTLSYRKGGRTEYAAVIGGFVEVLPDHVTVLADAAERAEEIDVDEARAALDAAKTAAASMTDASESELAAAQQAIAAAQARLEAATHSPATH